VLLLFWHSGKHLTSTRMLEKFVVNFASDLAPAVEITLTHVLHQLGVGMLGMESCFFF